MTSATWIQSLKKLVKEGLLFQEIELFPETFEHTDYRAIHDFQRPYIPISTEMYEKLLSMLKPHLKPRKIDFFLYCGKLFTIGNADGGYAIMPLIPEREAFYLNGSRT